MDGQQQQVAAVQAVDDEIQPAHQVAEGAGGGDHSVTQVIQRPRRGGVRRRMISELADEGVMDAHDAIKQALVILERLV